MSRLIIADDGMQKKLGNTGEPAMICAADGTVLGYFTPTTPTQKLKLDPQISIEELERRRADRSQGYTTEEVIAFLKSLPKKGD